MNSDSNHRDATPQKVFYSALAWCDQHGMAENADRMRAAGPPEPQDDDGYYGKLAFYERHAPVDPNYARLLDALKAEGPPPSELAEMPTAPEALA